ncbi:MAG: RNA polymerase Rpb4 family protein [Candidatus Altiarchaeota archaeon]
MNVLEEKPVALTDVSAILKEKDKDYTERGTELTYEQKRAFEHAQKFSKVSVKDAQEMSAKLAELGITLSDDRIVKIIDLMPKSVDDIRAIFAKERFKYSEEEIKKITDVVDQYR